jgi:hypothetical protein
MFSADKIIKTAVSQEFVAVKTFEVGDPFALEPSVNREGGKGRAGLLDGGEVTGKLGKGHSGDSPTPVRHGGVIRGAEDPSSLPDRFSRILFDIP